MKILNHDARDEKNGTFGIGAFSFYIKNNAIGFQALLLKPGNNGALSPHACLVLGPDIDLRPFMSQCKLGFALDGSNFKACIFLMATL
ncbi:hypothetical protein ACEN9X_24790 [Mucilaginibacter sp. Mucisp86]|uniref:hypothetical protein n=1 Tax=Mucilaginibacter sp. Mucisp86 TaxID=3243060 RepID=UPI0039B4336B